MEQTAIEREVEGDAPEWAAIVETHGRSVLLSLLGMGVPPDLARDVASRTWTRLIEQHGKDRLERLEFPGLAIRQARFLALDTLKRKKLEARILDQLAGSALAIAAPAADPEQRALSRQRLDRALEAIAFCPPKSQRVFRAVYERPDVTHATIAKEFDLSVQRVRQILCEVRRKVRLALAEDER